MTFFLRAYPILLLPLTATAQVPPRPSLAFEVASIKPSPPLGASRGTRTTRTGIDFGGATLRYCIGFAYRVKDYQISGPPWLGDLQFDIVAKAPENSRPNQFEEMLQTLLAERFKLRVHRETKEIQGLALVVAKGGLKLQESRVDRTQPLPNGPPSIARDVLSIPLPGVLRIIPMPDGGMRLVAGDVKISVIAGNLGNMLGSPVFDMTGATGSYDIVLDASREDVRNQRSYRVNGGPLPDPGPAELAAPSGPSIYDSLQKLGLKLESRKVTVAVIVVDSADKTPSEN
jgi:uncharacterized protein (TIGR03435 family)